MFDGVLCRSAQDNQLSMHIADRQHLGAIPEKILDLHVDLCVPNIPQRMC